MWTSNVFGYGSTLKDTRLVTRRYQELLKRAYQLRDTKGMSAFVYTQLTDAGQESNGLLTYDRAILSDSEAGCPHRRGGESGAIPAAAAGTRPLSPPDKRAQTCRLAVFHRPTLRKLDAARIRRCLLENGTGRIREGYRACPHPWITSDIYLRRDITLPAALLANLAFNVFHDENCEIYVNGVLAGSATDLSTGYVTVPMTDTGRAALKPGRNLIAVHCRQTVGAQYIDVGIIRGEIPAPP